MLLSPSVLQLETEHTIAVCVEEALLRVGLRATTFAEVAAVLTWLETNVPPLAIMDLRLGDRPTIDIGCRLARIGIPIIVHPASYGYDVPRDWRARAIFFRPVNVDDIAVAAKALT